VTWRRLPLPSTFEKARRREAYRRFARVVTGEETEELLPLDEVQRRLRAFEQTYVGVKPIPVDRIVGTSDRSADFDRDFLPRDPRLRDRWRRVEKAYPEGAFPPIAVYELDGTYFVIDGHHRVGVAKQIGVEFIDAEITRLQARYKMPEDADIGKVILAEQEQLFMDETGLKKARPDARIVFTQPMGYPELLELIKTHGYHVMIDRKEVVTLEEIADDWYEWIYMPTIEAIRAERLTEVFEGWTEADLFLWVWQRRRALFPELGGMTLQEAVRLARPPDGKALKSKAKRTVSRLKGAAQPRTKHSRD